ncbi:inducible metalloproteinase inhibitor protein-like [Cylas formicarius]|uniref:inducible metalloproteinase inhibitor protein-like n=1 Tax=Cylas formicarius TaxID=197179 RepID=UPI002958CA7E|nr:inducible metalloproteinase inhibitor protein-like [Cylas formicarius]
MQWYVFFILAFVGLPSFVSCVDCNLPSSAYCDGSYPSGGLACLNCTGLNECYGCGSACQHTCANRNCQCPIFNVRCNDSCYCKPGFARDRKGRCIPEKDCPPRTGPCPK